MVGELYKKVLSKNYESLFHMFRARIEYMLDDGYIVTQLTDEDREKRRQFM